VFTQIDYLRPWVVCSCVSDVAYFKDDAVGNH
jgi:hypothetical protein